MNRIARYFLLDDLAQVDDLDAASLHNNQLRHYDPTPGKWLSEDPIGYCGDDANVTPYVDRKPE
jgi:RHS repeat-associated protein